MKLSRKKKRKSPIKYIQYRTHHEIDVDGDEELGLLVGILIFIIGAWWGLVPVSYTHLTLPTKA